jgi:hypothetical protein
MRHKDGQRIGRAKRMSEEEYKILIERREKSEKSEREERECVC